MTEYLKISFCTVCRNRLFHLEQTFIQNVLDNMSYPFVEFNLLNYNSRDGLDEWASQNLARFIGMNIVKYYRTPDPKYFVQSHSKNMIFRLATGDVICNVDADNFLGKNFAFYINEQLAGKSRDTILITEKVMKSEKDRNTYGRICVHRDSFKQVRGFDERMREYGFEDIDLINRLKMQGSDEITISDTTYLISISHAQYLRTNEGEFARILKILLIRYISHYLSEVIFILEDGRFEKTIFVDNGILNASRKPWSVKDGDYPATGYDLAFEKNEWSAGIYMEDEFSFTFIQADSKRGLQLKKGVCEGREIYRDQGDSIFWKITDSTLIDDLVYVYPQIKNRTLMERNKNLPELVNKCGYGKGHVYCNLTNELIEL